MITRSIYTLLLTILIFQASIFLFPSPSPLPQKNNTPVQKSTSDTKEKIQTTTLTPSNTPAFNAVSSSFDSTSANLIRNSSFETESSGQPRGWFYLLDSTTGNTFISPEGIRSGNFGLKFVGAAPGNFGIMQPDLKTVPGRSYTVSVYVKQTNTPSIILRLGFWNEYLNKLGPVKDFSLDLGTKDWTRVSFTTTTPGLITDPKNMFPILEIFGLSSGSVYIDDMQLEEGSSLSVYNSAQAKPSALSGIGDGSIIFSPGGDIYPNYSGLGSLGSSTNKFQSLTLSNAQIDKDGNLTVNGSEIKGNLTINGNLTLSSTQGILHSDSSGSVSASAVNLANSDVTGTLPAGNGGTGATSLTQYGVLYGNSTNAISALTPGTTGYILQSNGLDSAPSWVAATGLSAGSIPFSGITSGTNTSAAMVIGSGASLTYSGGTASSGVINANQLLGNTWAAPGTIGITTPNSGSFTSLSASGLIAANGGLTIPIEQTLNLPGYDCSAQTNGGALTTTSGGVLTCSADDNGGGSNWRLQNGTLSPINDTLDLLIGNSASASAKFAFLNVNSGTPTASISANSGNNALFLNGLGNIQTTNRQTLTLGNSASNANSTGNILLNPNGTGLVGIGTTAPEEKLHLSGGNLLLDNNYYIKQKNSTGTAFNLLGTDNTDTVRLYSPSNGTLHINPDNTSITYINFNNTNPAQVGNGISATNFYVAKGSVGIGTTSPLATLDIRGNSATTPAASISANSNFAAMIVDNSGSGDLFTASSSGLSRFVITQSGNVGVGTTSPNRLLNLYFNNDNIATSLFNIEQDGTGDAFMNFSLTDGVSYALGIDNSDGNKFKIGHKSTGTPSGVSNGTMLTIDTSGSVGIGTTSPIAKLDVSGAGSATAPIASLSGSTTFAGLIVDNSGSGDLFTASKSGASKFTILNNGNIQINNLSAGIAHVSSTGVLSSSAVNLTAGADVTGVLPLVNGGSNKNLTAENGAIVYSDADSFELLSPSTSGYILQTNGAGFAPSWVNAGGTLNYWQRPANTGIVAPYSITDDLLLGGTSTASALFRVAGLTGAVTANTYNGIVIATSSGTLSMGSNSLTLAGASQTYSLDQSLSTGSSPSFTGLTVSGLSTGVVINTSGVLSSEAQLALTRGGTGRSLTAADGGIVWSDTDSLEILAAGVSGQVLTSGGAGAPSWVNASSNYWQLALGALSPLERTNDLLIGGTATSSSLFRVAGLTGAVTANTYNGIVIATSSGTLSMGGYNLTLSGNFSTSGTNALTLTTDGGTTNATIPSGSITLADLTTIQTMTNKTLTANSNKLGGVTMSIGSDATGDIYYNSGGLLTRLAPGTSGYILKTNGSGAAPAWTNPGGTLNFWQRALGALAPYNITDDLLLGGTSTASAKFAVLNVASGTPTASLSAGINGGAFLTADGYLSTTARQSLTIGNSSTYNSTGNILLNPNGTGNVGIGTTTPSQKLHLQNGTFLIDNPASPSLTGTYTTTNIFGIYVSGKYAYVAANTAGLHIIDISNPASPIWIGTYNTAGNAAGVYVSGKYAYVADATSGLQIIDISNPYTPTLTGTYNTAGNARDVYVSGKYAYVADYSGSGLVIIDISNPAFPSQISNIDLSDQTKGVYVSGKYAYVANGGTGLKIVDISNPASPSLTGTAAVGVASGVYVSGKYAYVAAADSGLKIVDISNPASPSITGTLATTNAIKVYVSGKYAYVADNTDGLRIIDVSNPATPSLTGTYDTGTATNVYVSGKYAYVNDSVSGLAIVDIKGADIHALAAGNISTNDLTALENIDVGNNLYVRNGINAGPGGIMSNGGLSINGSSNFVGGSNITPIASFSGQTSFAGLVVDNSGSGDLFTASKSGATKFTVANNGNVTINGSGVTGCILGNGTGATSCTASDRRLKDNITPLSEIKGLDAVRLLSPVSYKWNSWMQDNGATSADQFGFIAQDVASVFPNLVEQDKNTGYYKLDYQGFFAPLVKSIQELDMKVNNSGDIISSLALRVDALEQQKTASSSAVWTVLNATDSAQAASDAARFSSIEAQLSTFQPQFSTLNSQLSTFNSQLSTHDATISGTLAVTGRALLSDVGVTGTINAGNLAINGLDNNGLASINTNTGALRLQSHGLYGLDILDGKVTIAENGDITTKGAVTAKTVKTEKLNITADTVSSPSAVLSTSAGSVIILAGQISIDVSTDALTPKSLIFATPDQAISIGAKAKDSNTFTIKLQKAQQVNIKVNWWLIN